jgi:glycosyltransferase involved in cell wall biosynthesis
MMGEGKSKESVPLPVRSDNKDKRKDGVPYLSIVVPVFNEVENLRLLFDAITEALAGISYEIIFVDDGSKDGSVEILFEIAQEASDIVSVIQFRRNFGQTAAIAAGLDYSAGEIIVLLDADLQNDPADIPMLVEKIEEGYDVVSGWRVDRKDTLITRKIPSRMANWLISTVTGVKLHDYGCTLKAYRRDVFEGFRLYGEMHRFIPAYAVSVGARITEVPVQHHPRRFGETKYGLSRTIKVLLDLFTVKFLISYAHKPIYLFGGAGILLIVPSVLALLFLVVRRLWLGISILGSPLLQLSTMTMIMGFQSILMGLIAELLVRIYHESQAKPTYSIRKVVAPSRSEA